MSLLRGLAVTLLVIVAVVLQMTLFSHLSWDGVVPNLALLVVVAAAIVRGPQYGATLGLVAGLLLDLAPPAEHIAGRWALALVVVGYLAGQVRQNVRPTPVSVALTVAASSFIGTSIYALSGVVLGESSPAVASMLVVLLIALVWDVVMTPIVLPGAMWVFRRLRPERMAG